jgi:hypothetical protein
MPKPSTLTFQGSQQGGMTIIMALVLVSVLGAAVFSLSRNVVRELSMGGTAIQGEKAAAAADAGLDWAIVWAQGCISNVVYTGANQTPINGQLALVNGLKNGLAGVNLGLPITIHGAADATMTIDNGGAGNTTQTFDLELRCLGGGRDGTWGNAPGGVGGSSSNSNASNNTNANITTLGPVAYRILATGSATPKSSLAQTYQAQRELIATFPQ